MDPNNVEQLVQRNTMRGVSKPKYGRGKGRNTEGLVYEEHLLKTIQWKCKVKK